MNIKDKNGKPIELQDYEAKAVVGIEIGQLGHKLWVCIDGIAVLRVKAPEIVLTDMRKKKKKRMRYERTEQKQENEDYCIN